MPVQFSQINRKPSPSEAIIDPNAPFAQDLIGCWLFNESGGDIAHDYSGYGHHGTLTAMDVDADWGVGLHGRGLHFNGNDNNVLITDSRNLFTGGALSIFAWANRDTAAASSVTAIISRENAGIKGWLLNHHSNGNLLIGCDSDNDEVYQANEFFQTSSVSSGVWHHVGFTFNAGVLSGYIDGMFDSSITLTESTIPADSDSIRIAARGNDSTSYRGIIDSVFGWKRALTEREVYEHYQNSFTMFRPRATSVIGLVPAAGLSGPTVNNVTAANIGKINTRSIAAGDSVLNQAYS